MPHSHHGKHHHYDPPTIPSEQQVICPVTGDVVDMQRAKAAGHLREYKGKMYYFCCAACSQLFDKNPEKYVAGNRNS
jgi:YHS domain-containing protein